MKYWLLTTEYPPFYGGGISTYCFFTAKMLVQNGHTVTVFINDAGIHSINEQFIDGVRIVRFNPDTTAAISFLGHTTNLSYAFAQTVEFYIEQEGKPDLVEAQEYLGIAYYLLQYKYLMYDWCKEVPVLITMHSPSFLYMNYNQISEYQYPNYWICEMERFCLQAADLVISPSMYILKELRTHFELGQRSIQVIPNPFLSKNNAAIVDVEKNQIVFFGKLTAQKGAFELLTYFKSLWNEGFMEPLYLIGGQDIVYHPEGMTMGDLIRKKYKHYIDKALLQLEDRLPPEKIPQRLANAKLVIIPSNNDNLPYVVLEMMALGNIVLASKQGGQAEIITDGRDGFLFDHAVPETFKKQLAKILNLTKAEQEQIKQQAKQRVKTGYNLQTIYPQKIKAVESILSQQKQVVQFPFTRHLPPYVTLPIPKFKANLLSIIVPYYNLGNYLQQTVASLLAVTYTNREIIIVNDGSTDAHSLRQLAEYRNKPGIKVIDTTNNGLAATRNFGAAIANGEYLAFLDADDLVMPDYYTKAIQVLKTYSNVHFVGCWTQYFEGSTNIWPTFTPEPPIILYHNTINSSALVYNRAAFLQNGSNDTGMVFPGLEDYESVIALLAAGYRGVALPEVLFQYRVRKDSMIRNVSNTKKQYLLQYITQKHKKFYATFAAEIVNLLQANGAGITMDNPSLDYALYSKNGFLNKLTTKTIVFIKKHPKLKKLALTIYRKFKS